MSTEVGTPDGPARRLPGEEGVWVFILGDMVVFALFFGTLVVTRGQDPDLYRDAQAHLSQGAGTLNTMLLLTSSLFVALGLRGARSTVPRDASRWFGLAMLCALGFVVVKAFEYRAKVDTGLTPGVNDFWMYFFVFTGIHLLHVVIGLGVLAHLRVRVRRPSLEERDLTIIESGACYWHLVDLLWLVLFALLYLMA